MNSVCIITKKSKMGNTIQTESPSSVSAYEATRGAKKQRAGGSPTPSSDHHLPIPSLSQLEGVTSDAFMEEVDTWPKTRVNVLEQTRQLLNDRFEHQEYPREVTRLSDWFTSMQLLGSGVYGKVYKACVRAWDAAMHPIVPEQCMQYILPDVGAPGAKHTIFLIVKTMEGVEYEMLNDIPYAGHTKDFESWVGENNSVREVMMGRLLNLLVVRGVTPHVPLIYEPFHVYNDEENMIGFAMELAHMRFSDFIASKIIIKSTDQEIRELLDVAILQIADGLLCAHKHYDYRHNDFHSDNAMMTFITDTNYNYKVGDAYYTIPNYGMCWKLIDFGMSSSRVFGSTDNAYAAMHSVSFSIVNEYFDIEDYAAELYDLLRLIHIAKEDSKALPADKKAVVDRALDGYSDILKDISIHSDKRGSLQTAYEMYVKNQTRDKNTPLVDTTAEFTALMEGSGLVQVFFEHLAGRFKVPIEPVGVVFDSNIDPIPGDSTVLEGIHEKPIVVYKGALPAVVPDTVIPAVLQKTASKPAQREYIAPRPSRAVLPKRPHSCPKAFPYYCPESSNFVSTGGKDEPCVSDATLCDLSFDAFRTKRFRSVRPSATPGGKRAFGDYVIENDEEPSLPVFPEPPSSPTPSVDGSESPVLISQILRPKPDHSCPKTNPVFCPIDSNFVVTGGKVAPCVAEEELCDMSYADFRAKKLTSARVLATPRRKYPIKFA